MSPADARALRAMDLGFCLLALPAASVVFLLILPIQVAVFGPALVFRQVRIGRGGRPFVYYKLTSMRRPAAGAASHGRARLEVSRIPAWGRLLRAAHLDELPELLAVLVGAESMVGPRPLIPEHSLLVDSPDRRALTPGWTGLSQIYLRRKGQLPSRIQRRLDAFLGRELTSRLYLNVLAATAAALLAPRRRSEPGPTVTAYRAALLGVER